MNFHEVPSRFPAQRRAADARPMPRQVQLRVQSCEELIEPQVRPFRLAATVLTCVGATALLICTIGSARALRRQGAA